VTAEGAKHIPEAVAAANKVLSCVKAGVRVAEPVLKGLPAATIALDGVAAATGEISWTHWAISSAVTGLAVVQPEFAPLAAAYWATDTAVSNLYPGGWEGYGKAWGDKFTEMENELSRSIFVGYVSLP
jgi:hypothetical protein